jgi:hypothetical protein
MVTTAEQAPMLVVLRDLFAPAPPAGQAARALADGYLRAISADWQGEPGWQAFERSLNRFWSLQLPPVPRTLPDAVSPHGAGGRGVHWYESETEIIGYVPGKSCGYRVPIQSSPFVLDQGWGGDRAAVPDRTGR